MIVSSLVVDGDTVLVDPSPHAALWEAIQPYVDHALLWVLSLLVGWIVVKVRAWFGLSITAAQEESVRQALLTGAHRDIALAEGEVDRRKLIEGAMAWAQEREGTVIKRLGWDDRILWGVAAKMVAGAVQAAVAPPTKA